MRSRRRNVIAVLSGGDSPAVSETGTVRRTPMVAEAATDDGTSQEPTTHHRSDVMAKVQTNKKSRRKSTIVVTGEHTVSVNKKRGVIQRFRRSLFRPKVLFAVAVLLVGASVGPMIPGLLPDPEEREEYQFETANMAITPPAHDVPPDILQQVIRRSKLPETLSLLDDDLTHDIAAAFAEHPWVAEVVSVRKSFPPEVKVELRYRQPIAMIETKAGLYPVDASAVLLPPEDFSMSDTRRYPTIRGVRSRPQGPAGQPWGDSAVNAAVRLAEVLQPHWNELQLGTIIVPAAAESVNDLKFEVATRGGSRILWGRAPGVNHPGELTVDQKVGRLKKYLNDFGRFDHPNGPYEIDIRHWQEITRRPLSAGPRRTTHR